MTAQEKLMAIHERLDQLKHQGVKMKDVAASMDLSPSVLSALYATVLPAFRKAVRVKDFEEALTEALSNVNNLSRKRLMVMLDDLYRNVMEFPGPMAGEGVREAAFLRSLERFAADSGSKLGQLEGIYMSYSCSSSVRTLKAEPFYFTRSGDNRTFVVGRKSVHGVVREGIGIVQERQILYLLLNAFQEPDLSLVTVYLQLPFLERIHYLRGLYLVPDYNQNPIARRIVLVKLADHYTPEEFERVEARLIPPEEFSDEERLVYDYTCGRGDSIKMCTLPSPKLDLRDLSGEKNLLETESE